MLDHYSQTILADNPTAYWRLGERTGTTAADSSGNGHTGTYTGTYTLGSPGLTAPAYNSSLSVSGAGYVDLGTADIVTGAATLEAWVRFAGAASINETIAARVSAGAPGFWQWIRNTSGKLQFNSDGSGGTTASIIGTTTLAASTAYHVALTCNGLGTYKLYVNGVLDATVTGQTQNAFETSTERYSIARRMLDGLQYLSGAIDEVAFYGSCLSADRLTAHYRAGVAADLYAKKVLELSPVAYWRLGDLSGTTITDSSGNGHHGTQSAGVVPGVAGSVTCSNNASARYDGSSVGSVPDFAAGRFTSAFTIQFRIRLASAGQTNRYILTRSNTDGSDQTSVIYGYVADKVEFFSNSYTGSDPRTGSQITISDTDWHDVAYTYDGSTWAGYLDGAPVFSVGRTFSVSGSSLDSWFIGAANAAAAAGINADLDEIALHGVGLSATQIAARYRAGTSKTFGPRHVGMSGGFNL